MKILEQAFYDENQYESNEIYRYLYIILKSKYQIADKYLKESITYNNISLKDLGVEFLTKNLFNQEPIQLANKTGSKELLLYLFDILLGIEFDEENQFLYNPVENDIILKNGKHTYVDRIKSILIPPKNFSKTILYPVYQFSISSKVDIFEYLTKALVEISKSTKQIYYKDFTLSPLVVFAILVYLTNSVDIWKNLVVPDWDLLESYRFQLTLDLFFKNYNNARLQYAVVNTILEKNLTSLSTLLTDVLSLYPNSTISEEDVNLIVEFVSNNQDKIDVLDVFYSLRDEYLTFKHFYLLPQILQKDGLTINVFLCQLKDKNPYNKLFYNIKNFIANVNIDLLTKLSVDDVPSLASKLDDCIGTQSLFRIIFESIQDIQNKLDKINKRFGILDADFVLGSETVIIRDPGMKSCAICEAYPVDIDIKLDEKVQLAFVAETDVDVFVNVK